MKSATIYLGMLVAYPIAFGFLAYATLRGAPLGGLETAILGGLLAGFVTLACNARDVWNIYQPVDDPQLEAKAPEIYFPAQMLTYLSVPVLVVMGHAVARVLEMRIAWPPVLLGLLGFWGARGLASTFDTGGRYSATMMTQTSAKHRHERELRKRARATPRN